MVIKITMKNTILFLATVLLIFHTFPYMQAYYSFAVTVGLFGLIMVLFFLGRKSLVIDKRIMTVLFLDAATVLLIMAGVLIRNFDLKEMVGKYLPYIMWPTLYAITEPLFDEQSRKKAVTVFLIAMAVGVVSTLKVVSVDENASRLLAGAASMAKRLQYYKQGVGGYGFIYGMVFNLFCVLAWMTLEKKPLLKATLLALSITSCVMIFFASYTTAVLLTALVVLLALFSRTNQKNAAIYLILIACVFAVFFEDILIGIRDFAENLDMRWITKRINQLLEAETSGDMDSLRRVELYKISFETFTHNILLGGPDIGGHSMFLDTIANYGLFGVTFIAAFYMMLNEHRRNCTIMKGSIYYLCMLFLCINTMDFIVLLPMMTFALPLFLKMVEDKKKALKK